jgi:hypothetical protein
MSTLILGADKALVVPRGSGNGKPLVFNLTGVFKAESRLIELQAVTRLKAGELTHAFLTAWRDASTYCKEVKAEFVRGKRAVREARAVVVLDRVQDVLKDKGLSSARSPAGSEDLRDSVVALDKDYQAAAERLEEIEAAMDYLEIKAETFKMAYFSVDKLLDPSDKTKREFSGGAGTDDPGALTEDEKLDEFVAKVSTNNKQYQTSGFGPAKL